MLQFTLGLPFWQCPAPSTPSFTVVNPAPVTGVFAAAEPANPPAVATLTTPTTINARPTRNRLMAAPFMRRRSIREPRPNASPKKCQTAGHGPADAMRSTLGHGQAAPTSVSSMGNDPRIARSGHSSAGEQPPQLATG